jgi:hypothetical protein
MPILVMQRIAFYAHGVMFTTWQAKSHGFVAQFPDSLGLWYESHFNQHTHHIVLLRWFCLLLGWWDLTLILSCCG